MEVITENPIIYIGKDDTYDAEIFLSLDGSNPSLVRDFKEWANDKYKLGLKVDGKEDNKTRNAYKKYGEEYEKDQRGVGLSKPKVEKPASPTIIPAVNPSPKQIADAKKKGFNWDKARGVFIKAQELGIIDALLNKIGITPKTTDMPEVGVDTTMDPTSEEKKGMSTTTKVVIGVGVLAIIGVIYFSKKSK